MTTNTPVRLRRPEAEADTTSKVAPFTRGSSTGESSGAVPGARSKALGRFRDPLWSACAAGAAALVSVAALMPLWRMELVAPQYPSGLHLTAYGNRMQGDLSEINTLNHYVGVAPIHPDEILELSLFPFLIGGLVVALLAGAVLARNRWQRALMAMAVWSVPVGFLADLQWWLHRYGQDLDPQAPLRLEPFTPKVLGSTQVMNFHTETMVAFGFWLLVAAGLLITFGPAVIRFVRDSWRNTGDTAATVAMAVALATALGATTLIAASEPVEAASTAEVPSITEAIAAAAPGATVVIPAGTYKEQVVIDKPVTLIGEGAPVIDGGGLGDVVRITAPDVTLRGFVVRNSARAVSDEPAGIRVRASRATIEGNRLEEVLYGIVLQESDDHLVRDNTISSVRAVAPERRGHALYVWYSQRNLLEGNHIQHAKDGVFLGFAVDTRLVNNVVTQVRYGVHTMYANDLELRGNIFRDNVAGASLMYSRGLLVVDNEFSGNRSQASGYGLLFKDMDDVLLAGNRIVNNRLGITMDGAPRTPGAYVTLRGNLIAYNQVAAELFRTVDATFVENTFIGNLQQVESRGGSLVGRNRWSEGDRGNHWDDYQGFDADGDGVGDVPYRYEGAYDDLVRRNEALKAYAFTPTRAALDLAARWFPVYRSEARVVDEYPLVAPTINLGDTSRGGVDPLAAAVGLLLGGVAALVFWAGHQGQRKAWA